MLCDGPGDGEPEGRGVPDAPGDGVGVGVELGGGVVAEKMRSSAFWNVSAMTTLSWVARMMRCSSGILLWVDWMNSGFTYTNDEPTGSTSRFPRMHVVPPPVGHSSVSC